MSWISEEDPSKTHFNSVLTENVQHVLNCGGYHEVPLVEMSFF